MSAPAMPSPARLIKGSVLHLRRKGYDEAGARKIIKEVVEALASDTDRWEPWALDWWRRLWTEAHGTGATSRTPASQPGKDRND